MPGRTEDAMHPTRAECAAMDAADPLAHMRDRFVLPEGVVYLGGNSIGAMAKAVAARVKTATEDEWALGLKRSWNDAGWFTLPARAGDKIARLIGAPKASVIVADTISVNLFKLLSAALDLVPGRRVILSDTGNFPSDLYVAQGLIARLGRGLALKVVEPEDVEAALDETVGVLMLTEVDYRTARIHDMRDLTTKAHSVGAVTVWDLAHSAGAIEVDVTAANVDFAHGCTYKYLNGGPGAPAYVYVRPDLMGAARSPISGWWGHEAPFAFDLDFRPAPGIVRFQCGTQPILTLSALDAALDEWADVDMATVRAKSVRLTGLFTELVAAGCAEHGLRLAGPGDAWARGSHVSLHCPHGLAVMRALVADGVIGDFRAPDVIRFGFAPLYNSFVDAWDAADRLARILEKRRWDDTRFREREAVT